MAFKRSNYKELVNTRKEFFASSYGFTKKTNFKAGSDVYVIPLGLETGYYITPCHRVNTHKVDGKTLGFNGFAFAVNIKCKGIDAEGNLSSSLCCTLAKMEKERFPEKDDYSKRVIGSRTNRVHLPVLVLGNSLNDDTKISYPISKVALKKDLMNEGGLKFSFIDISATTFQNEILLAYGKKLKEEGVLDYELDETTEEFLEEVVKRLSSTVIKIHGGTKQGFSAAIKEYSFFPFSNAAIASSSGEGERDLIVGYKKNTNIMQQVNDYLALFDAEVDGLILDWTEKDLQEYYNSAIGVPLSTPIGEIASAKQQVEEAITNPEPEEVVVVKKTTPQPAVEATPVQPEPQDKPISMDNEPQDRPISMDEPTKKLKPPASEEEIADFIKNPNPYEDAEAASVAVATRETVDELDEFEFDAENGDEFFD